MLGGGEPWLAAAYRRPTMLTCFGGRIRQSHRNSTSSEAGQADPLAGTTGSSLALMNRGGSRSGWMSDRSTVSQGVHWPKRSWMAIPYFTERLPGFAGIGNSRSIACTRK